MIIMIIILNGDCMKKYTKVLIIIISSFLALSLAIVSVFLILTHIGKLQFHKDDTHISTDNVKFEDQDTINYNEKKYTLNKNVVSILVMGIDRDNVNQNLGMGKNGQADVIFVATIDTKTKKTCIIPISRETMVDVNYFTQNGEFSGSQKEQLCLAYAYGNTTEDSSKNVMTSVRRFLCGININSYVTLEMKGVEKLTDMVGGVEITCLENINTKNFNHNKGEKVLLNGKKAGYYIAYRDDDIEAHTRRMQRQKQFLSALISKTGNTVLNDFSKLTKFYTTLSPYYKTNVSFAQITYLAQNCLVSNFGDRLEYKIIDGTLTQGEEWVEFNADPDSVLQTVIDVFYLPVK